MAVIANAFVPGDALDSRRDAMFNRGGVAPELGAGDFVLWESYQVRLGAPLEVGDWQRKACELARLSEEQGVGIVSVTTSDDGGSYAQGLHDYAWYSALLDGHVATGWGERLFAVDGVAPFRPRPEASGVGSELVGAVKVRRGIYSWQTDRGRIEVDTHAHTAQFRD